MSQPSVLNTPVVIIRKDAGKDSASETRSTGSPLLDSFVFTQKVRSTIYLAQPIATEPARQPISPAQAKLALQSLPTAKRLAANQQARQPGPAKPTQVSSVQNEQTAESRTQPIDKSLDRSSKNQTSGDLNAAEKSAPSRLTKPQNQAAHLEKQIAVSSADAKSQPKQKPTPLQPVSAAKHPPEFPVSPVTPTLQRSGKRLPNPSLERAAAVGMLDLSDKLLFGGEDDTLISTYLGDKDPLTAGGDETIVLKYLSKQIAESKLTKIKGRLPLAVRAQPEVEPSQAVLDARNFRVVKAALKSKDVKVEVERKPPEIKVDVAAMGQQIAHLSQQVEILTKELSKMAMQETRSGSGEAA